ncbi:hypothetical protein F5Y04DRAFT_288689 [Hypomontagnella monticulosa]|nr:hypothetical protein F5Y04DRAFT_288689 [Hypomontagnella monticulosa]
MTAELALAIVATIEISLKWGGQIIQLCRTLEGADREIIERAVRVEACWVRISKQLDFLRRTADLMEAEHLELHQRTLEVLLNKLQVVRKELESVSAIRTQGDPRATCAGQESVLPGRKLKFALKKHRIDEAVDDLEKWQGVFDISWLLALKIADQKLDTTLDQGFHSSSSSELSLRNVKATFQKTQETRSIFLRGDGLASAILTPMPCCEVTIAHRKDELLILDTVVCNRMLAQATIKDVRSLAQNLQNNETTIFGFLRCKGVMKEIKTENAIRTTFLTIVFKVPPGLSEPVSLRASLMRGDFPESLSEKIKLARQLAKSVSYVHIFGFVHKNIRPETVIITRNPSGSYTPFIVGFGKFRREDGLTQRYGDENWEKNLYRHPRRQGLKPEETYVMQHDIYSLGVCLLEIGLWKSLVTYNDEGKAEPQFTPAESTATSPRDPVACQNYLLALAQNQLPKLMGSKYAEVVKTCLTCLDKDNEDFGDESEFMDEDGIIVGVRYIEKVILRLNSISV